jgi:predicted lipid-binding transport protein (Tim44 family)
MSKVPDGFYYVRGHIRRNPRPRSAKRMSGWMIAGVLAGVWLWGQLFGFGEAATKTPPAHPQSATSAPADR